MFKVLGLDYGEKRVGVALSSDDGCYAFTSQTIENKSDGDLIKELRNICQEEAIETIVLGLPLDQNGALSQQAKKVQQFGRNLNEHLGIPVVYEDERFSSALAYKLFREAGKSVKDSRNKIDQKSAQLILQTYLDKKNAK